jgi:Flp pilus assembly protein TadD
MNGALPDILNDLGVALERAGRSAEAEQAYREQVSRGSRTGLAESSLGRILLDRGETEAAIPFLETAAGRLPEDEGVQGRLVLAHALAGRPEEALAAYERAIASSPGFASRRDRFLLAAEKLGLVEFAVAAARR